MKQRKRYKMGYWNKIGKFEVKLISSEEYKIKDPNPNVSLVYNFLSDDISKTIAKMESGEYQSQFFIKNRG